MPEILFAGPEGRVEGRYHPQREKDSPIALILHPHPQFGGTMNNRVVYNLHYCFHKMGFQRYEIQLSRSRTQSRGI